MQIFPLRQVAMWNFEHLSIHGQIKIQELCLYGEFLEDLKNIITFKDIFKPSMLDKNEIPIKNEFNNSCVIGTNGSLNNKKISCAK